MHKPATERASALFNVSLLCGSRQIWREPGDSSIKEVAIEGRFLLPVFHGTALPRSGELIFRNTIVG
jgi:hypothetical protein